MDYITDVTIYEDMFSGESYNMQLISLISKGNISLICQNVPDNFRNLISSVKIQENRCVKFYKAQNCVGSYYRTCKNLCCDEISKIGYNDKIQSMIADTIL